MLYAGFPSTGGCRGPVATLMETHIFKILDGHEIVADLYPTVGHELKPAILFIHGGGLTAPQVANTRVARRCRRQGLA